MTRLKRFYVLTALTLAVTGLVTVALLQPVVGTRTDFSIYNTRWNGASSFARDVYGTGALAPTFGVSFTGDDVTIVHRSFAEFDPDPARGSLLLLAPQSPPTAEEAEWLRAFLAGGGRVVLADDFGEGNAFLEAIGSDSRFRGPLVLDLAFVKKPAFVVSADFDAHRVTQGVEEVVLDYGTALEPGRNATPLARTDSSAWLDRDGNEQKDAGEPRGPFAWLSVERVGRGELVLLSDPSVLINGMRPLADNEAFALNLVTWLTEDERRVLVDESHRDYVDPVRVIGFTLQQLPDAWRLGLAAAGTAAFVGFAVVPVRAWARAPLALVRRVLDRVFPPPPEPERDLVARVRERHPDWDETTLTGILTHWEQRS